MSEESIKRISIKEFREKGYLQELNRRFLHPLGLALEVIVSEDGSEKLGGIWDYRDDKEGMHYGLNDSEFTNQERLEAFKTKYNLIETEINEKRSRREKILGFYQEPIPEKLKED